MHHCMCESKATSHATHTHTHTFYILTMAFPQPVDFAGWIASIAHELKPPVGNKLLFGGEQKVMVVGGPNSREDYHIEEGEEIFYQLRGDMVLETMEHGIRRSIRIPEGHIFCLPGRVPHSPQRLAGTVGLVIERERRSTEIDGLRWYTRDGASNVLYEEWFHCTDLGVQLKPVIDRFFAMDCYKSGTPDRTFEAPPFQPDTSVTLEAPVPLFDWVTRNTLQHGSTVAVLSGRNAEAPALRGFEFRVSFYTGPSHEAAVSHGREVFLYQLVGDAEVELTDNASRAKATTPLRAGYVLLVPGGRKFLMRVEWPAGGVGMMVELQDDV